MVGLMTTKALIPYGGAIGAEPYLDRAGIMARTVKDAALVLDAIKDPEKGYFDPRDKFTALPKGLISEEPYANFVVDDKDKDSRKTHKPLAGMRIGIVREYMVKHVANDVTISDIINEEIKYVLRDKLIAELVESFDPLYPDDPDIPNMEYTFQDALAEILPQEMPEYFFKKTSSDALEFAVPGFDVTTRDYLVKLAEGEAPLSDKLNMRRITSFPPTFGMSFHLAQYLMQRGDERVYDWATLNANAKFNNDANRAKFENYENKIDFRSDGITEHMKMRDLMRLVVLKVMYENDIDVLVNPTITIPATNLGFATEPGVNNRPTGRFPTSADLGIPEIVVPAGYNQIVYEPQFVLNAAKDNYNSVTSTVKSIVEKPLPISIAFWAGPGEEPTLLTVASAYEAATHHRSPPPDFGPL